MEDIATIAFVAFALAYLLLLSYCAKELLYALLVIAAMVIVIDGCGLNERKTSSLPAIRETVQPFEYE